MSIQYIVKIPAFALVVAAEHVAFNPPTAPPQDADRAKFGQADTLTKMTSWFPILGALVVYSCHISECAGVIAHEYPSTISSWIVSSFFKDPTAIDRLAINPSFALGFLLVVGGATLRKLCYDTLGKYFTFQQAIMKDHKLITTGPYAVVRHPAYTGFLAANTGLLLLHFGPGSYVWESGVLHTSWKAALWGAWASAVFALQVVTMKRVPREDAVMKKEFGQKWNEWAMKTPYKLIPYVY